MIMQLDSPDPPPNAIAFTTAPATHPATHFANLVSQQQSTLTIPLPFTARMLPS
jgi:hypothetical protein